MRLVRLPKNKDDKVTLAPSFDFRGGEPLAMFFSCEGDGAPTVRAVSQHDIPPIAQEREVADRD